jgi:hypothetical protein
MKLTPKHSFISMIIICLYHKAKKNHRLMQTF